MIFKSMLKRDPIRVLQLGSPTGLYGAERWILALVKHLDPGRIEPTVAVIKDDPTLDAPLCREAEKLGVRVHIFEAYGKANLSTIKLVRDFINRNGIQIIHTHWYKADLVGLLATRRTNCKTVSTPHGWSNEEANFKLTCYEMINRCIFPFLDAVVPLSDQLHNQLQRIPGFNGNLHLIRNGVDTSEIDSTTDIAEQLQTWHGEGVFIIGYIGRLVLGKGLDVLIKAVSRIHSINWRLAIVGDGEQRTELEALAQNMGIGNRVKFFGFQEKRLSFLRGFDVFVLPSRSEGIPRSLMEAMATGIPAIASDIPGCRNLVHDGHSGLLFPVDEDDHLAERITRTALDEEVRHKLSNKGRNLIHREFSAIHMAKQYAILYDALTR
jgi:glycosyltransferase involved in cell wall biosynthesis